MIESALVILSSASDTVQGHSPPVTQRCIVIILSQTPESFQSFAVERVNSWVCSDLREGVRERRREGEVYGLLVD